ncbi:MAG: putative secreted protein [Variovorax sp.]|nr:putative secreted protein [Variovorax sp.]
MGVRSAFLLIIVLLIAALAALNWSTLATPTAISLGFMQVTAPLGLVMLGLTTALGVFFLIYVLYLQSSVLLEGRRHAREIAAQRELADKAEASRFTELRLFLEQQEQKRTARVSDLQAALIARVEQSDNTMAAHLGQIEDRLERRGGPLAAATPQASGLPDDSVIVVPRS